MAHFGMIIPSKQMIVAGQSNTVDLKVISPIPWSWWGSTLKSQRFSVFSMTGK
jgi:hypothetical protein